MEFDYVIVGGGSAGSVLAARLSEDPQVTVCLLEAGGDGKGILVRAPLGVVAMLPGTFKINNWARETVPQPGLDGRRGYQPSGRGLGGSSAINAMLYVRGHPSDYDDWARAGCDGWGWSDVLPIFQRSERNVRGADALHGDQGPLQVAEQQSPRPISRAFIDAAAEVQIRRNDDFNGPEQEGAGLYQVTQFWQDGKQGERCSAAAAYLHPVMDRPNLTVLTGAHATRIITEGARATAPSTVAAAGTVPVDPAAITGKAGGRSSHASASRFSSVTRRTAGSLRPSSSSRRGHASTATARKAAVERQCSARSASTRSATRPGSATSSIWQESRNAASASAISSARRGSTAPPW